jgi:O-antigen ligase
MISNMSIIRSKQLNTILIIFIGGFLVYSIYQQWPYLNKRFNLAGINNAQVGMLFYFFAVCVLFHIHSSKNLLVKIVVIALLSACFIIAFYSATRTAFFGFLIAFVIYLFFYFHIRLNKIYPIILLCSVIVFIFILLPSVNKSIKARYLNGYEDAKKVIRYVLSKDSSFYHSVDRIRIWEDALSNFKKNPALGSGLGISYHDKILDQNYVHPHNIILELLAETGVVGFGIFLTLFGLIFKKAFIIFNQTSGTDRLTLLFYPLSLIFFFLYSSLHSDLSTEYFKWYLAGMITGFDVEVSAVG